MEEYGLEEVIEELLDDLCGGNVSETEEIPLKQFVQATQTVYKVKNWWEADNTMDMVIDYAREITGPHNALENAQFFKRVATSLKKTNIELKAEVKALQLLNIAFDFYRMAGDEKKAEKLWREMSYTILNLNRTIIYKAGEEGTESGGSKDREKEFEELEAWTRKWDYEKILEKPIVFWERINGFTEVPFCKKVLEYLFTVHNIVLSERMRVEFFAYVRNGFTERESFLFGDVNAFDSLWKKLSLKTKELYEQNGFEVRKCDTAEWEAYFRKLVFQPSYQGVEELALATRMSVEQLEHCLVHWLKRSGIDWGSPEEIWLYLTLKYSKESDLYCRNYKRLHSLYACCRKWQMVKEEDLTVREGDAFMGGAEPSELLSHYIQPEELFHTCNEDLKTLFRFLLLRGEQYADKTREVFFRYVEELREILLEKRGFTEERLSKRVEKEQEKRSNAVYKKIRICYGRGCEITIPRGTEFACIIMAKQCKEPARALFVNEEELHISGKLPVETFLPVKALTEEEVLIRYREVKKLKHLPEFVKEKYLGTEGFCLAEAFRLDTVERITLPEKGSALAFCKSKDKGKGRLLVRGEGGTLVPKGTGIFFRETVGEETFTFCYEVTEDVILRRETEITLCLKNMEELWKLPQAYEGKELAPTGSILYPVKEQEKDAYKGITLTLAKPLKPYETEKSRDELETELAGRKSKGGIRKRSEARRKEAEISDLEMLTYIYNAPADSTAYYKGVKGYGEEFLLNTKAFVESRLKNDILHKFVRTKGERQRSLILTVLFLIQALELENMEREPRKKTICRGFEQFVDEVMEECNMVGFQRSNSYDAFLEFLLCCDEPLSLYACIWGEESPFSERK